MMDTRCSVPGYDWAVMSHVRIIAGADEGSLAALLGGRLSVARLLWRRRSVAVL